MSLQPTCHSASCSVSGGEPLTALLLPPPPHSPGTHTAKEQWSQEPGAHLEHLAALLAFSDQKGSGCSVDL